MQQPARYCNTQDGGKADLCDVLCAASRADLPPPGVATGVSPLMLFTNSRADARWIVLIHSWPETQAVLRI